MRLPTGLHVLWKLGEVVAPLRHLGGDHVKLYVNCLCGCPVKKAPEVRDSKASIFASIP